jgi:copper resistance protein C
MMRLTLLVVLAMPIPALAHALLERASPPVGSELAEPPRQLTLTFTEGIEPLFSTIELRTANGAAVPLGKPHVAADNRQLLVDLPVLKAGEYTVVWHVTSVDTHKTEGSFRFTVR